MSSSFLTIEGNRFMLDGRAVRLKGTNYQDPASPWSPFQQWSPDAAKRGLAAAAELGMNCARLWSRAGADDGVPKLLQFLDIAERHGIRAYVVPPWPNTDFVILSRAQRGEESRSGEILRCAQDDSLDPGTAAFIADYFGALRDDPRILAWDLMNEADWVSDEAWQWTMSPPDAERRLRWFQRVIAAIKEADANHPISMGATFSYSLWRPAEPFTLESLIDFADFHYYRRNYRESTLAEEIRAVKAHTDRPIICGEFGFSSDPNFSTKGEPVHNEPLQAEMYDEYLRDCEQEEIAGLMQWCLVDYLGAYGNGEERHGILRTDYSRKPAADVFARRFPVDSAW
jgi:endo-1,4-beta-mannosidase